MVVTRLEADIEASTPGHFSSGSQSHDLGMGFAGPGVESLTDNPALFN